MTMTLRRKERHTLNVTASHTVAIDTQVSFRLPSHVVVRASHRERDRRHPLPVPRRRPGDLPPPRPQPAQHQLERDGHRGDSSLPSPQHLNPALLTASSIRTMRHYNSIRFVVLAPRGKTCRTDHFFASLQQLYPSVQNVLSGKTDIVAISINDESLLFTCSVATSPSFAFHYTIYWAVASLSSVRRLVEDLRRLASRAGLVCIQYPTELASPFDNALSPLFYSRRVEVTNDSNMDYFLQLMDAMFYRVNECEGGYVGYTDAGMKEFAQINHGKRSIRVIDIEHKNGEKGIVGLERGFHADRTHQGTSQHHGVSERSDGATSLLVSQIHIFHTGLYYQTHIFHTGLYHQTHNSTDRKQTFICLAATCSEASPFFILSTTSITPPRSSRSSHSGTLLSRLRSSRLPCMRNARSPPCFFISPKHTSSMLNLLTSSSHAAAFRRHSTLSSDRISFITPSSIYLQRRLVAPAATHQQRKQRLLRHTREHFSA